MGSNDTPPIGPDQEGERGTNRSGRGSRPVMGRAGNWPPSRQGETQVRYTLRLPPWRGRQQGRRRLDEAQETAAAEAWLAELADVPESLADELAERRHHAAAYAVEQELLDAGELLPRNTDRLPPGWAVADPATLGLGADGAQIDTAIRLAAAAGAATVEAASGDEDQGAELGEAPGLGARLAEALELGAGRGQAIMLAARILDQAGTVDGALELAAAALRVLGQIAEPVRQALDEDTRKLGAMLQEHYGAELGDEPRGDA